MKRLSDDPLVRLQEARGAGRSVGAAEARIAELEDALRRCKCHLANAIFILHREVPGHQWTPHMEKGLREAKQVLGEKPE